MAWVMLFAATALAPSAQTWTKLVNLKATDGFFVEATLVEGSDGNFYGTAPWGGNVVCGRCGTMFKITPQGELTVLCRFCSESNCADGAEPYAGLVFKLSTEASRERHLPEAPVAMVPAATVSYLAAVQSSESLPKAS